MSPPPSVEIHQILWLRRARQNPAGYWELATAALAQPATSAAAAAVCHAVRARCAVEMFDTATALSEATRARELRSLVESESTRADLLATYARCLIECGRLDDARIEIESASEETGRRFEWLLDLERCARAYKAGEQTEAMEAVQRCLAGVPSDRPDIRAKALNNRGVLCLYLTGLGTGLADFEAARHIYRSIGHDLDATDVTFNMAMQLSRSGDLPASLRAFDEAEVALRAAGEPIDFLVVARAEVLTLAGLVEDVLDDLPETIARLDAAGLAGDAAEARLYLAVAQLAVGHRDAHQSAVDAAEGFRRSQRSGWEMIARDTALKSRIEQDGLRSLDIDEIHAVAEGLDATGMRSFAPPSWLRAAEVAVAHGDDERAVGFLREVVSRRTTLPERVLACEAQAKIARLAGDVGAARRWAERGLRIVERNRAMFEATELWVTASGWGEPLANILVEAMWDHGSPTELLGASERWRWTSGFNPARRPDADEQLAELLSAYRAAERGLAEIERSDGGSGVQVRDGRTARRGRTDALRRSERGVADALRRRSGNGSSGHRSNSAATLSESFVTRTLIEFISCRGQLAAITVGPNGTRRIDLGDSAALEDAGRAAFRGLRNLAATAGTASEALSFASTVGPLAFLRDHLIAPLHGSVDGANELIIVPTGLLQLVPWQLLLPVAVSVAPSAASWVRSGESLGNERNGSVAAFAGPGLPGAINEIGRVVAAHQPRRVEGYDSATAAELLQRVDGAALIHIASHGRFRSTNPLFSGIEMSDGPVTAIEFERLDNPPQAIVLSGCSTGVIQHHKGGEVVGLATSLLAAGASTIIASILPLSDHVAVDAFERLHQLLAGGVRASEATMTVVAECDTSLPSGLAIASAIVCCGRGDWSLVASTETPR